MTDNGNDKNQSLKEARTMKNGLHPMLPMLLFFALLTSSVGAAVMSMVRVERQAQHIVNMALAETLRQHETTIIDADTIKDYRSRISLPGLRDTAYIAVAARTDDCPASVTLEARTGLSLARMWRLSDQRASALLAVLAAIWLAASVTIRQRNLTMQPAPLALAGGIDELHYDAGSHRFTVRGRQLSLTPMQQELLQLFMQAPDHRLLHRDICDYLWPKKPDASATLYTLVRRLKKVLAEETNMQVECDRGQAYTLH